MGDTKNKINISELKNMVAIIQIYREYIKPRFEVCPSKLSNPSNGDKTDL